MLLASALCACAGGAGQERQGGTGAGVASSAGAPDAGASSASLSGAGSSGSVGVQEDEEAELTYPTAWLIVDSDKVPAGTAVRLLSLPDIRIEAHRDGKSLTGDARKQAGFSWPSLGGADALVEYKGSLHVVDPDLLLVNLPDVMPEAVYDIVYSYSSTSNCAGIAIPGVTGKRLVGYADGKQESAYWGKRAFAAPCAYRTALKALKVARALGDKGYRLLVYDAYRPMSAQYYLSDAFAAAYESDQGIQEAIGDWPLSWFVASGPSGHNYGTDLDVGVCDPDGTPAAMPSTFDAFDERGHLTQAPMSSGSISPASYRDAVRVYPACMALHKAFTDAGFSELASEWWHFGDKATEAENREVVGSGGLDFTAVL